MGARAGAESSRGKRRGARAWTIVSLVAVAACVARAGARGGARARTCPAVCAHRLASDDDGDDSSAANRSTALRARGIACADVDVSLVDGELVVAHPSELTTTTTPRTSVRDLVETFARDEAAAATGEGGEEGWISLELKDAAFRAESYAEIDAMVGEAARRFGKRPRVFVFVDNEYRGDRWETVRRSVEERGGVRNIQLAWAARDVQESARDAKNVDARALRARGVGDVVFPSVKMSDAWYAKARRERLNLVPWIVDTREDAVRAVRLGVMGVITNTPLKTQQMLHEICGTD